eukprot:scaffold18620_cov19-Tisochrysis_lutea.AAC.1
MPAQLAWRLCVATMFPPPGPVDFNCQALGHVCKHHVAGALDQQLHALLQVHFLADALSLRDLHSHMAAWHKLLIGVKNATGGWLPIAKNLQEGH